jgi:hypothetical protein
MVTELKDIILYFENLGWKVDREGEFGLYTDFLIGSIVFELNAYLLDGCLRIEIPNFTPQLPDESEAQICFELLKLNSELIGCKFSILPDRSILLSCDLLANDLDFDTFRETINILIDCISQFYEYYYYRIPEKST